MGVVYLIQSLGTEAKDESSDNITANYKIGCTKGNVVNRKNTLQTGNSNELQIIRTFKTKYPFKLEKMLHLHYHKEHIINEWFYLSDEEVLNFEKTCKKYNDIICFLKIENPFF
jgi:hypothetical protein